MRDGRCPLPASHWSICLTLKFLKIVCYLLRNFPEFELSETTGSACCISFCSKGRGHCLLCMLLSFGSKGRGYCLLCMLLSFCSIGRGNCVLCMLLSFGSTYRLRPLPTRHVVIFRFYRPRPLPTMQCMHVVYLSVL